MCEVVPFDQIWENLPYGIFCENEFLSMVDNLYHNLCSSFRPIVHLVVEIQRFVCNRTTLQEVVV